MTLLDHPPLVVILTLAPASTSAWPLVGASALSWTCPEMKHPEKWAPIEKQPHNYRYGLDMFKSGSIWAEMRVCGLFFF